MTKTTGTMGEGTPVAKPAKASVPATIDSSYPILAMQPERLAKVIRANLGNSRLTEFQVDRISVPTGGGTLWTVPGLEGETNEAEIQGIVVSWKEPRAYWKESFDDSGGGTPPDCTSDDGVTGLGEPGGNCGVCPLAQFGSHHKGRGQACKQMRVLFLVRENDFLPIALSCPPTSLDSAQKYFLRLASRGVLYNHVITSFKLSKERNKDGIFYSFVAPTMVRMLSEAEIEAVDRYSEAIQPSLERARVQTEARDFA